MTTIDLSTHINASIELVFDLSRSIDFHMEAASQTGEKAIAGRTSGLISYGETVTWRGKHFGVFLKHSSKIVEYEPPLKFTDQMIEGHFQYFRHEHTFLSENGRTIMKDRLKYEMPFGIFGRLFDFLFLKNHLKTFIERRNTSIMNAAENNMTTLD